MKISLRKEDEKTGFFRKTMEYALYVQVDLTAVERAAIVTAGLEDSMLMEYAYRGTQLNWRVKSVVHSSDKRAERRFVAQDIAGRNAIENTIKEVLSGLKAQIEEQVTDETGSKTIEL